MANSTRYDWYQTGSDVVVTVLLKNIRSEDVQVHFGEKSLSVTVKREGLPDYSLELDLAHPVQANLCSFKCLPSKIEIKMRKDEHLHWNQLEGEDPVAPAPPAEEAANGDAPRPEPEQRAYPTSHAGGPKDWDAIEKQAIKDEEDEKLEGDQAVNRMFQQIYKGADEDVKRAMLKSFTESKGTCLSTNWSEVGRHKVECKPPDGMEWKNYDK